MKVQRVAGQPTLALAGEFTGDAGAQVQAPLEALLRELGPGDEPVGLDLSEVDTMDSAGFSSWVRLERLAQGAGRRLRVIGASPLIRDLFVFADLEEVLAP